MIGLLIYLKKLYLRVRATADENLALVSEEWRDDHYFVKSGVASRVRSCRMHGFQSSMVVDAATTQLATPLSHSKLLSRSLVFFCPTFTAIFIIDNLFLPFPFSRSDKPIFFITPARICKLELSLIVVPRAADSSGKIAGGGVVSRWLAIFVICLSSRERRSMHAPLTVGDSLVGLAPILRFAQLNVLVR